MKKMANLLLIGAIIVMFGIFSGCISDSDENETQDETTNTFTEFADDYGKVLAQMKATLTNHYNEMDHGTMSQMMSMMMDYHSDMIEYMAHLNHDLDGMIEYCSTLGMHDEGFWEEMEQLHEDCLSEIKGHYNDMMDMDDHMGAMGEMDDHMGTMGPYMAEMEESHAWMLNHDAYDHHDDDCDGDHHDDDHHDDDGHHDDGHHNH
ncbi:hypothetical protein ACFL27_03465 [candidate division CSSED10-310 bacterium]|uniref:Uncharacterized protein n=1 Tax=candidate division CSSED10-310 bacterium TaxID=2855610 RepID=A0ABV6YST3_UNCC1